MPNRVNRDSPSKDLYKTTLPAAALGRFAVGSKGYFNDIFGPLSSCSIYANDIESWPKPLAYSFTVRTVNVGIKLHSKEKKRVLFCIYSVPEIDIKVKVTICGHLICTFISEN